MQRKWFFVLCLCLADSASFAQNSTCLPILGEAVKAIEDLNDNFAGVLKRYDAFLNTTLPDILNEVKAVRSQVNVTTKFVENRFSLASLAESAATTTGLVLGVGITAVAAWRFLRFKFCPELAHNTCHCERIEA